MDGDLVVSFMTDEDTSAHTWLVALCMCEGHTRCNRTDDNFHSKDQRCRLQDSNLRTFRPVVLGPEDYSHRRPGKSDVQLSDRRCKCN